MVFSGNSNKIPKAKDGVIYLREVSAERFIRIRIVSLPKNFSCRLGDLSRLSQKLRQVCCVSSNTFKCVALVYDSVLRH